LLGPPIYWRTKIEFVKYCSPKRLFSPFTNRLKDIWWYTVSV
jgi:hypothetical protein